MTAALRRVRAWLTRHVREWPLVTEPLGGLCVADLRKVVAMAERCAELEAAGKVGLDALLKCGVYRPLTFTTDRTG